VGGGVCAELTLETEKPIYPWIVADCDPRSYRLNSGQVIASRYPLANPEFVRYTNRVGEDKMAGKGVLGCTGARPGAVCVCVCLGKVC
jgi:hypothetical protein